MPEPRGPVFPYHRIVDDLRSAILAGRLAPGDRLSSEWELAQQYQTSRPTVRRAVAVLKAEGLVITEQGRGTFVRPVPHVQLVVTGANYRRHRSAGLPGFNAQVSEQGQRPAQLIALPGESRVDIAVSLQHIAHILGLYFKSEHGNPSNLHFLALKYIACGQRLGALHLRVLHLFITLGRIGEIVDVGHEGFQGVVDVFGHVIVFGGIILPRLALPIILQCGHLSLHILHQGVHQIFLTLYLLRLGAHFLGAYL